MAYIPGERDRERGSDIYPPNCKERKKITKKVFEEGGLYVGQKG